MDDGVNARIVSVTAFREYFQRPDRFLSDGVTRSAVRLWCLRTRVFDRPGGYQRVRSECVGRQVVHELVLKTVATDFMSLGGDIANQERIAFGYPAQDEECGFDLVGRQQIKQELGARFDS